VTGFPGWSLRTKLTAVLSAVIGFISLAVFLEVPSQLRSQAVALTVENAYTVTEMAAFDLAAALFFRDPAGLEESLGAVRRDADLVYVVVTDADGRLAAGFNADLLERPEARASAMEPRKLGAVPPGASRPRSEGGFSPDGRVFQAAAPVTYNGRDIGRITIGFSLDRLNAEVAKSRRAIALVSLVIFLAGISAVFALSTVFTEPLARIVEASRAIAAGDLGARASVSQEDEIGRLARTFNGMVDRLEAAQRELASRNLGLEERYRVFVERNLAGVYVVTEDGRVLDCNDAFAQLLGFESAREFLGEGARIETVDPAARQAFVDRLRREGAVSNNESALKRRDGATVWVLESVRLIEAAPGTPAILEGIVLDITDRKRAEMEIERRALHDELTGLPNRNLFADRLGVALALARRTQETPAILFLDVDDLKVVNDTLGHATGDALLRMVAERLRSCLREGDTVARIGGDEFTVLLPTVPGEEDAADVARKILEVLAEPFFEGDDELHVRASVGVAVYPGHGETPEALLKSADGAMYRVKVAGGGGFEVGERVETSRGPGRLSLEEELRRGLERGEFVLHYQPQVNIRTGSIVGLEALIRWRHPEHLLIEPKAFIALAETSGLIIPMGEWVLYEACRQMKAWRDEGFAGLNVAVNVSARQFYQRDFMGMVRRVLRRTGLPPANLELEITESLAIQKSDWSSRILEELKQTGVRIALDDFGTGQSSLSYLRRFPIDSVKIDQTFVKDLTGNANVDSIVIATLLLANRIALRTVAEGVETRGQLDFLRVHGCLEMQGFLVSRALPAAEIEERFLRPLLADRPPDRG
jgi:diguanylate cyclase (GGDEF)-like protein/PAS domain S-box-containing protein